MSLLVVLTAGSDRAHASRACPCSTGQRRGRHRASGAGGQGRSQRRQGAGGPGGGTRMIAQLMDRLSRTCRGQCAAGRGDLPRAAHRCHQRARPPARGHRARACDKDHRRCAQRARARRYRCRVESIRRLPHSPAIANCRRWSSCCGTSTPSAGGGGADLGALTANRSRTSATATCR